jgi:hypothetical protein
MKKKALVVGIILLFIGLAIAPSVMSIEFSKNKTSNNDDLVEITLQLCKTSGVEDHKMFITQEQNKQLELLIESFKEDLDNSGSYEETVRIYNDMVVSLDELGLLPNGMNVKEAQKLVTGSSHKFNRLFSLLERLFKYDKNEDIELQDQKIGNVYENSNCLISSKASETYATYKPPSLLGIVIGFLLTLLTPYFLGYVYYGFVCYPVGSTPANGWIHTESESKKWTCEGKFHGGMGSYQIFMHPLEGSYRGIEKFRGLKIVNYVLGRAKEVKINGWVPWHHNS